MSRWDETFEKSMKQVLEEETGGQFASMADMKREAEALEGHEKRALRRRIRHYTRETIQNAQRLDTQLCSAAGVGARAIIGTVTRGAAIGVSAAGVVNTIAPGLFSTAMGYSAASLKGTTAGAILAKLGLVSFGVFAQPKIAQGAILVLGAVLGIAGYAVYRIVRGLVRMAGK